MIILDATLRDGGYHNQWNFDLNLANYYLLTMEKSRINAVEIGFRNPDKPEGNFANVTDKFIFEKLYKPDIEYFGVMINAATSSKESIRKSFSKEVDSPINLVRVAVHFKDTNKSQIIFDELKKLGYIVTCNLMQAADKSYEEIKETSKLLNSWGNIDVLYLADSLGGMNHDSVHYSFAAIKEGWNGLTGFHGHNNKGTALDNSLEALDIGVQWLDGTICGMGRGPGNTETEYLLFELNKRGVGEFVLKPIYELVINNFKNLHDEYKWGPSLFYYLAAEGNIHPTYVQTMLSKNYKPNNILNSILYLENKDSSFFNKELLEESMNA
jgi:4-hydroxy 2-oxovalerate aldolase